jgi:hypothetical protein
VVAARGRDDARWWHRSGQQVGEGAARLERSGMLQEFQLELGRAGRQAKVREVDVEGWGVTDVRADQALDCGDALAGDRAAGDRIIERHCAACLSLGLTGLSNLA